MDIANHLLAECEGGYATLQPWFGNVAPTRLPFRVYVTADVDGAMHFGCTDTEIYVGTNPALNLSAKGYALLLAAEVVEVLGATVPRPWDCGSNTGEGLSRVLASAAYPGDEVPELVTSTAWLDETAPDGNRREDWIDHYDSSDTNQLSTGCAVLFLNWLRSVRGHSWTDIVAAGDWTFAMVFRNVGESGSAWQIFRDDMEARFPSNRPANLTTDNPF